MLRTVLPTLSIPVFVNLPPVDRSTHTVPVPLRLHVQGSHFVLSRTSTPITLCTDWSAITEKDD